MTREWIEIIGEYSINKNVRFKTPLLKLDLCDYNDAYIFVKGVMDLLAGNVGMLRTDVALKSNAPCSHA